jgi:hypothetical protein
MYHASAQLHKYLSRCLHIDTAETESAGKAREAGREVITVAAHALMEEHGVSQLPRRLIGGDGARGWRQSMYRFALCIMRLARPEICWILGCNQSALGDCRRRFLLELACAVVAVVVAVGNGSRSS